MDTITRMRAFVAVVDSGGYSAAARETGRSKALMSKYVAELEEEFGARLLNRTTRQLSLTEAGTTVYGEAKEILRRVEHLQEGLEAASDMPRGRLRVSMPRTLGESELGRAVMDFLMKYPEVRLDLLVDDRFVDLVSEGFDVAIRISSLADSSLIARKLDSFRVAAYATPSVIASHGRPAHPSELASLPCVVDTNLQSRANWPFQEDGSRFTVPVRGRVEANSPAMVAAAVRSGLGFGRSPWMTIRADVEAGRLMTVLEEYELDDLGIYIVYPHRDRMPAKLRAFIDYIVEIFDAGRRSAALKKPR